jgi:hypothetical protein
MRIAVQQTALAATRLAPLRQTARPVRGSRSVIRAGTYRATEMEQAAQAIAVVAAQAIAVVAARAIVVVAVRAIVVALAAERTASAAATWGAADRAQAEDAMPSALRAGTTDRVRVPQAAAVDRALAADLAVARVAAAEDADEPRLHC